MKSKVIWVLTIDRAARSAKVGRSHKELTADFESALNVSSSDIVSWDADTYISYNCKLLHALSKQIFN